MEPDPRQKIPVPQESKVIKYRGGFICVKGDMREGRVHNHGPEMGKYANQNCLMTRFIIGEDYRGPGLPQGTSEIHDMELIPGTGGRSTVLRAVLGVLPVGKQVIAYKESFHMGSIYDTFLREETFGMGRLRQYCGGEIVLPIQYRDLKVEEHEPGHIVDLEKILGITKREIVSLGMVVPIIEAPKGRQ